MIIASLPYKRVHLCIRENHEHLEQGVHGFHDSSEEYEPNEI